MVSKSLTRKIYLLVLDALGISGIFLVAIYFVARPGYFEELIFNRPWYFVLPVVVYLLAVYFVQGYHLEEIVSPWKGLTAMTMASLLGAAATGFLFFFIPTAPEFSARVLVAAAISITLLLWIVRLIYGWALGAASLKENLLIIGTSASALELNQIILERARSPYAVVGLLVTNEQKKSQANLIELADLPRVLEKNQIDSVVLGINEVTNERLIRIVSVLKRRGIKVRELIDLYEEMTGKMPVQYVGELKMLFQNFGQRNEFIRFSENLINRFLAGLLLLITLPVWIFIIIGQQLTSPGPIFVENSNRVGELGRVFRFYKFRSMVPNATKKGAGMITATNDPRVTPFGRFIRKTHMDELPQLLNILKGDMNFIGPRAEYIERVSTLEQQIPFYHERHMIKPGVTGWAQVRNVYTDASREGTMEKIQYDLYYLKNRSLALDLAIVIRTIKLILQGRGTA